MPLGVPIEAPCLVRLVPLPPQALAVVWVASVLVPDWGLVSPRLYGRRNSRIGPEMISMVPSISFLDLRGASIAALGKFESFVGFHHKTLLFGHYFLKDIVDLLADKYFASQSASLIECGLPGI